MSTALYQLSPSLQRISAHVKSTQLRTTEGRRKSYTEREMPTCSADL
ncbi:hypothetical protein ABZ876_27980 [Streptomyces sp. NPDC046931]